MTALTTVSGVNATKYAAIIAGTSGVADFMDGANEWGTKLRCMYDEYTVPVGDTVAVSTTVTFGTLPKGAKPLFAIFTQSGAVAAATAGITIGGTAATSTTALTDMTSATLQLVPFNNAFVTTVLSAASAVAILLTSSYDLDAETNLTLAVFYILED